MWGYDHKRYGLKFEDADNKDGLIKQRYVCIHNSKGRITITGDFWGPFGVIEVSEVVMIMFNMSMYQCTFTL